MTLFVSDEPILQLYLSLRLFPDITDMYTAPSCFRGQEQPLISGAVAPRRPAGQRESVIQCQLPYSFASLSQLELVAQHSCDMLTFPVASLVK